MTTPIMPKTDAAELINAARIRQGLTWATIAEKIDAPLVWTVAALLGKHPVPATKATAAATKATAPAKRAVGRPVKRSR